MAQVTDNQQIIITKWQERIKRGFLWITILKLYNDKEPLSGTDLKTKISELHNKWDPSPGSIYPILKELHEDGLIIQVEDPDKKNKVYVITDLGSELLTAIRNEVFAFRMHPVEALKRMSKNESDFKQKFTSMIDDLSPDEVVIMREHFEKIHTWFGEVLESKMKENTK